MLEAAPCSCPTITRVLNVVFKGTIPIQTHYALVLCSFSRKPLCLNVSQINWNINRRNLSQTITIFTHGMCANVRSPHGNHSATRTCDSRCICSLFFFFFSYTQSPCILKHREMLICQVGHILALGWANTIKARQKR